MAETLQEKMYEWTNDKIRWYHDACVYPDNNRDRIITELILEHLKLEDSICDLGCGIGSLSMALSDKVNRVIAIDQNAAALNFLKKQITEKRKDNIEVINGDYRQLKPREEPPKAAVLCMAGRLETHLPYALKWFSKKLFFITGNSAYHSFKPGQRKASYEPTENVRTYIENYGLMYREQMISVRFGQPLKSKEEAMAFMRCYNRAGIIEDIKADLEKKLVRTQDKAFPWYYPCDKSYRVFIIEQK